MPSSTSGSAEGRERTAASWPGAYTASAALRMKAEPPKSENSFGLIAAWPTVTTFSRIPCSRMRSICTPTRGRSSGASRRSLTRTICPSWIPAVSQRLERPGQPDREPGAAREDADPGIVAGSGARHRRPVELRPDDELVVLLVDVADHPRPAAQRRPGRLGGQATYALCEARTSPARWEGSFESATQRPRDRAREPERARRDVDHDHQPLAARESGRRPRVAGSTPARALRRRRGRAPRARPERSACAGRQERAPARRRSGSTCLGRRRDRDAGHGVRARPSAPHLPVQCRSHLGGEQRQVVGLGWLLAPGERARLLLELRRLRLAEAEREPVERAAALGLALAAARRPRRAAASARAATASPTAAGRGATAATAPRRRAPRR